MKNKYFNHAEWDASTQNQVVGGPVQIQLVQKRFSLCEQLICWCSGLTIPRANVSSLKMSHGSGKIPV
jgi:hypothetical protein